MTATLVSLDDYRARKLAGVRSGGLDLKADWVLGEPTGNICAYCGRRLRHAILEPHGIVGQGCESCEVWFSGKDDPPK